MKLLILAIGITATATMASAQDVKEKNVPAVVKQALAAKYSTHSHISWEMEKGNYEANFGGRSGEDTSVVFTPAGVFIEMVKALPKSSLPANAVAYIKAHYNTKILEVGKVTDPQGNQTYEAEIKGKDLIFSLDGGFIKED